MVCTYNRSQLLKQCLESLSTLIAPSQGLVWEILVIDNNSTDDTKNIVEEIKSKSRVNLRYFIETQQGIVFARNRAVKEARYGIIAFVDDDETADKNWLENMAGTFKSYDPDCVGGKMLPAGWPEKLPAWFTQELHLFASIYDRGDALIEWTSVDQNTPYSGNIAYKKSVFDKLGYFDISMGRRGKDSVSGGEEQDLNIRILENGGKIIYQPKAVVYHAFRPQFLKKSYYRNISFYQGQAEALSSMSFKAFFYAFYHFIRRSVLYIGHIIKHGYNRSFRQELYCWRFFGFVSGAINPFI